MIERYLSHGYMCEGGVHHPSQTEGYTTLEDIFALRPPTCRYAILQHRGNFIVADMYDVRWMTKIAGEGFDGEPVRYERQLILGTYHTHPTYDAAVMAAALTYLIVSSPDKPTQPDGDTTDACPEV